MNRNCSVFDVFCIESNCISCSVERSLQIIVKFTTHVQNNKYFISITGITTYNAFSLAIIKPSDVVWP